MERQLEEIGAEKDYNEQGSQSIYLQFLPVIWRPRFLDRILEAKIIRNEFRLRQLGATEISGKCQNKERNCYNQKNLYAFKSFSHFQTPDHYVSKEELLKVPPLAY